VLVVVPRDPAATAARPALRCETHSGGCFTLGLVRSQ